MCKQNNTQTTESNLMSIRYLISTEPKVNLETMAKWGNLAQEQTDLIEYLFNMHHYLVEYVKPGSDEEYFNSIAYSSYMRLPYTLYCIQENWKKGYYLECITLLRHIIEGFATLRFFVNNKNLVRKHVLGATSKDRVKFIKMFDTVVPGFYRAFYGKIYSNYAHGGFVSINTRVQYDSPTEGKVLMGCVYGDRFSKLIIDHLLTFTYGYLNYLDEFFPTIKKRIPSTVFKEIENKLSKVFTILDYPRKYPEGQENWDMITKIFISK